MIILTAIAGSLTIAAALLLNNTLPAELARFIEAQDSADVTARQGIPALLFLLNIAALLAGLTGLWWCQRWARLLFSAAAVLVPPLSILAGMVMADALVSNAFETGADAAFSMFVGAIIAMTWFGMPDEFKRTKVSQPAIAVVS
jgi:hypothetical protein